MFCPCVDTHVIIYTINTFNPYFLAQISSLLYLELFLLREALCALSRGVANERHRSDKRAEPRQHLCDFLHAVSKRREDHHSGIRSTGRGASGRAFTCLRSQILK